MNTTLQQTTPEQLTLPVAARARVIAAVPTRSAAPPWTPFLVVAFYALAMGWVESAVVFYMRTMINRLVPYQPNPLPFASGFGVAEIIREAATMRRQVDHHLARARAVGRRGHAHSRAGT